ncbi:MAG: dihydrofolate reductase [Bdellovibrionales bacterium]|nr:dihydrofolate reductase [Bdellovibrionales bacterium]
MKIAAIAAMARNRVIGKNNQLPWHLPEDMEHFKKLTQGATVLMGRKTYESLPPRFRPLPNRKNIVISNNPEKLDLGTEVQVWSSLRDPLTKWQGQSGEDTLWIIGGAKVYAETVSFWDEIYLTVVFGEFEGDAFFPEIGPEFELVDETPGKECVFQRFQRVASGRVL